MVAMLCQQFRFDILPLNLVIDERSQLVRILECN